MSSQKLKRWTKDEDQYIRERYTGTNAIELGDKLDRTPDAIKSRAYTLKINLKPQYKVWTKEEDREIEKNYPDNSTAVIAEKLNRSMSAVQSRAKRIRVYKRVTWNEKQRASARPKETETLHTLSRQERIAQFKAQQLESHSKKHPFQAFQNDILP